MQHTTRSNRKQSLRQRHQILVQLPVYYIPTKPSDLDQATGRTLRALHNVRSLNILMGSSSASTSLGIFKASFDMVYDVIKHRLTLTYNGAGGTELTTSNVTTSLNHADNYGRPWPILLDLIGSSLHNSISANFDGFRAPAATYLMGLASLLVKAQGSSRINRDWFDTLAIEVSAGQLQGIIEEAVRAYTGVLAPELFQQHTPWSFLRYMEHARADLTLANAQQ